MSNKRTLEEVEDELVGALARNEVHAFIIQVALLRIGELVPDWRGVLDSFRMEVEANLRNTKYQTDMLDAARLQLWGRQYLTELFQTVHNSLVAREQDAAVRSKPHEPEKTKRKRRGSGQPGS